MNPTPNLKKLTLLHFNDLHGDFLAEQVDDKLVGGVSMLSGYINQVRQTEKTSSTLSLEICFEARLSIRSIKGFLRSRS